MDFPHRGGEEGYLNDPHYFSRQEDKGRGYEEAERYPRFTSVYGATPYPPAVERGYEEEQYPRFTSAYEAAPYAPADPYPHVPGRHEHETSPGPYGSHGPSGPYYPHPQRPAPFERIASEREMEMPLSQRQLLPPGQLVRVFCKKNPAFNLAAEHNTVIMKPANTQDEAQQWIKDESYGMRVKDNYGHSAFTLINKKTGQILQHAKAKGKQVLLMDYRPDIRDDDILWSESQDFGEGFKTVRCASDTLLNLTVFEGIKTVHNGSPLVLDTWHKGDHQLWKLFPLW